MKLRYLLLGFGLTFGALLLFAQDTPKPQPPATKQSAPAAAQPAAPEKSATPDTGQLSELEKTKLENLSLRMTLLNEEEASLPQRKSQIQVQYSQAMQQILAEHPAFVWNPQTGGLVPKPVEKAAEKKAEPKPEEKK
jgi:hypothetical protein